MRLAPVALLSLFFYLQNRPKSFFLIFKIVLNLLVLVAAVVLVVVRSGGAVVLVVSVNPGRLSLVWNKG